MFADAIVANQHADTIAIVAVVVAASFVALPSSLVGGRRVTRLLIAWTVLAALGAALVFHLDRGQCVPLFGCGKRDTHLIVLGTVWLGGFVVLAIVWFMSRVADGDSRSAAPSASGANPPPGWMRDPTDPTVERWWDGTAWGDQTRRGALPDPNGPR